MSEQTATRVYQSSIWEPRIKELEEAKVTGAVFYTDGGQRIVKFKSRSGWGIHGYFYNEDKPQGLGSFKMEYPTAQGYLAKNQVSKDDAVNVTDIINIYGNNGSKTNNVAELEALLQTFEMFFQTGMNTFIKKLVVRVDSKYVLDGTVEFMQGWKRNGWRKLDGQPVKNVQYWKEIDAWLTKLEEADVELDLGWVKGHVDSGNIIADQMATLGLLQDKEYADEWIKREDYMRTNLDINPLLLESKLLYLKDFFEDNISMRDGHYYHWIYNNNSPSSKINEMGRNLVDSSVGFVATTQKQEILDSFYKSCEALDQTVSSSPKVIDLSLILKPNLQIELSPDNISKLPLEIGKKDIKLRTTSDKNVITVLEPPRNSMETFRRAVELLNNYRCLTDKYSDEFIETDITEHLFDTEVNGKGVTKYKFKVNEDVSVDVVAPIWKESGVVNHEFTLTFGLDLPRRRVFSNIKDLNPKVSIFTWYENEFVSYFATIIRIDGAYGVWMAELSNTVLTRGPRP